MGWWIICIVLFAITAGLIVWRILSICYDFEITFPAVLVGLVAIGFLIGNLVSPIMWQSNIYEYKQFYAYYDSHKPENKLEDVALTQTKLEKNQWLYESQFTKQFYPFWTLAPDEIMDLKPID